MSSTRPNAVSRRQHRRQSIFFLHSRFCVLYTFCHRIWWLKRFNAGNICSDLAWHERKAKLETRKQTRQYIMKNEDCASTSAALGKVPSPIGARCVGGRRTSAAEIRIQALFCKQKVMRDFLSFLIWFGGRVSLLGFDFSVLIVDW